MGNSPNNNKYSELQPNSQQANKSLAWRSLAVVAWWMVVGTSFAAFNSGHQSGPWIGGAVVGTDRYIWSRAKLPISNVVIVCRKQRGRCTAGKSGSISTRNDCGPDGVSPEWACVSFH